jgi:tetratricopeptide (TPR) repeat protein
VRSPDELLELAERVEPFLYEADQAAWLDWLEAEHDDLRAAFDSYVAAGDGERALRLVAALGRLWHMHGHLEEGRRRTAQALLVAGESDYPATRAKALDWAGTFARYEGDHASARSLFERALALHEELGDESAAAGSLHSLGLVARAQGDDVTGRRLLEESLARLRKLEEWRKLHNALHNVGDLAADEGDYASARSLHEESFALRRKLGNEVGIAASLLSLGVIAGAEGDQASARSLYLESMNRFQELGDEPGVAECLEGVARVHHGQGLPERAATLLAAARAVNERLGVAKWDARQRSDEELVDDLRRRLGDELFDAAWQEGLAMSVAEASEYASSMTTIPVRPRE